MSYRCDLAVMTLLQTCTTVAAKLTGTPQHPIERMADACCHVQAVMRTSLREGIRQHFLHTSEHAKRLSSVKANAKFSSLEADADTPWMARASASFMLMVLCLTPALK